MLIFGHFETLLLSIAIDETLYLLTVFNTLKVILCITLVLFFYEIQMGIFGGRNLYFYTIPETLRATLMCLLSQFLTSGGARVRRLGRKMEQWRREKYLRGSGACPGKILWSRVPEMPFPALCFYFERGGG